MLAATMMEARASYVPVGQNFEPTPMLAVARLFQVIVVQLACILIGSRAMPQFVVVVYSSSPEAQQLEG
jgi:predicted permease